MSDDSLELIARGIRARGLALPAVLLLEMHRPLGNLVREAANLGAPFLSMLVGPRQTASFREALSEPRAVERLITLLER